MFPSLMHIGEILSMALFRPFFLGTNSEFNHDVTVAHDSVPRDVWNLSVEKKEERDFAAGNRIDFARANAKLTDRILAIIRVK